MQELDPRDLTAGQRIAATGTMSVGGQVGDVGGVAQKTVAVRNAGATVFFVPVQEKHPAIEHAGGRLRVFAVSSISEVLADLQRLGGRMAAPPSAR
jgi:PDZ domain-containing protein